MPPPIPVVAQAPSSSSSLSLSSSSSSPPLIVPPEATRDDRVDRSIRPLGSARRPGRSRTPTPSNPHPNEIASFSNVNHDGQDGGASTSLHLDVSSSRSSTLRNNPPHSIRSRSTQSHSEKRPWFPYPSPHASFKGPNQRSSSSSARRISTISNESNSSQISNDASTSSASSYNSEDLTTRLQDHTRRAISAEPEQWSHSTSRGRPIHTTATSMTMTGERASKRSRDARSSIIEEVDSSSSSSSSDEEKERAHFKSVLQSFDAYLSHSLAANNARRRSFYSLPRSHRLLLSSLGSPLPGPLLQTEGNDQTGKEEEEEEHTSLVAAGRGFKARLDEIDDRIRRNADVLSQIVDDSRGFLGEEAESGVDGKGGTSKEQSHSLESAGQSGQTMSEESANQARQSLEDVSQGVGEERRKPRRDTNRQQSAKGERESRQRIPDHDLDKVRSTIKQYVRDWSREGLSEREAAYDPILEALEKCFHHISSAQRNQLRILVPGAGLGRLAFEIAWLGFSCQGNEFSFYMLLASHFILNKTIRINQHVIYPFIHSSSNWRTAEDMLRPIQIPDINPTDLPSHVDFSMVAGEFVEVYSKEQEKAAWDAVTTCFFIDTAHNLTRYLEVINQVLVIGGIWINVGPLLWHYEGAARGDLSIELTLDEVLGLVELMGFHIESQRTLPPQTYTGNHGSMLTYQYSPEFWIAKKIRQVKPATVI